MRARWTSDPCYAFYGVDGSDCSFLIYLSEVEWFCPPLSWRNHTSPPTQFTHQTKAPKRQVSNRPQSSRHSVIHSKDSNRHCWGFDKYVAFYGENVIRGSFLCNTFLVLSPQLHHYPSLKTALINVRPCHCFMFTLPVVLSSLHSNGTLEMRGNITPYFTVCMIKLTERVYTCWCSLERSYRNITDVQINKRLCSVALPLAIHKPLRV